MGLREEVRGALDDESIGPKCSKVLPLALLSLLAIGLVEVRAVEDHDFLVRGRAGGVRTVRRRFRHGGGAVCGL